MSKSVNSGWMNNLYTFYRALVTKSYADDVYAGHIEELSYYLHRVVLGDIKRLCVAMPPRHSKSSMITLAFPFWLILRNPNLNIMIVNSEGSLSENFGIRLRELFRRYDGLVPDVHLSDVKHSSTHLKFCDDEGILYEGSIRLTGSNGSITGQNADYLILDDPYKGFEDITPTLLQKKMNWFDTIIEQRIEPQSRLIILHTRWHSMDIQGVLKKERVSDYTFVKFPAILPDGSPLWKERYSIDVLNKKRESVGERIFQSIYQQEPIDATSDFFDMKKVHWLKNLDGIEILETVRGYDIAGSSQGDYTAGVPVHSIGENKVLITDYLYGQFGSSTRDKIKETVKSDGPDTLSIIETGVAAAGKLLFEEWKLQLRGYWVERALPVPSGSKADRATPLQNAILDGEVYACIKDDDLRQRFREEFMSFPDGVHDDIVDATAYAYNYLKDNCLGSYEPVNTVIEWYR